jgi:hypothetical protein
MTSPFLPVHVPRRHDQGHVSPLVNEKHNQIPARVRLSSGGKDILTRSVARFHETIPGSIEENLFRLILSDMVLYGQFLNDLRQPDEVVNVHSNPPPTLG